MGDVNYHAISMSQLGAASEEGRHTPRVARAASWLAREVTNQRRDAVLWVPIALGSGMAIHLALPEDPAPGMLWLLGAVTMTFAVVAVRSKRLRVLAGLAACLLAGFLWAEFRSARVAAPVLAAPFNGTLEGTITAVDRSANGRLRLVLTRPALWGLDAAKTPASVRVSLAHPPVGFRPLPGQRILLTARLSAPPPPAEPGGFDFRRSAFFRGLGATGYATGPAVRIGEETWRPDHALDRLRMRISDGLRARLNGRTGAFAAAILTGDRSELDEETLRALRASNLAHLMAISGLHMGLVTALAFAALRGLLALAPSLAMRFDTRRPAAAGAIAAALLYLFLSGTGIAAQRAMVMAATVMGAVLLQRRAVTMRGLALAATVVLLMRPESLVEPGFQMSFAATAALVTVFGWFSGNRVAQDPRRRRSPDGGITGAEGPGSAAPLGRQLRKALQWAAFLGLSSLVAGAATAPIAAAHFNQVARFGLVANMASVPVMGLLVMPAAMIALLLWPIGAEGVAVQAMGAGIDWILWVADQVAAWPGATRPVQTPPESVLPLLGAGLAVFAVVTGHLRAIGVVPLLAALLLWQGAERPVVLLSGGGQQLGLLLAAERGRALRPTRRGVFVQRVWLENDGKGESVDDARARWPARWPAGLAGGWWAMLAGDRLLLWRKADGRPPNDSQPPRLALDLTRLPPGVSLAVTQAGRVLTTEPAGSGRPWARPQINRAKAARR